ncbi:tyrosine-protein kinase JAK3 [Rhinatrema bivittatum]|uniref:tyrosine-protein kinase JAK3 n=1 Tax=Rhinatrema bivittatum TaxID=194408 RepID=UPI00112D6D41|nr:tyrosine-protein kinase JAK3 [Rhinatrema bivittatum]XP_029469586.1 tyrosine-protein kinase JAK3 [Rhinatrema bivittatum]
MAPLGDQTPLIKGERSCSLSSSEAGTLQIYLYPGCPRRPFDSPLTFSCGKYSAEELCVMAAKACGILPVYQTLFALATEDLTSWFSPKHIFTVDESMSLVVVYRIRFFFPNWFGLGSQKSYRHSLPKDRPSAVLDCAVIDYLFAQCRSDFVSGRLDITLSPGMQQECLALAVLDMLRIKQERGLSFAELLGSISYKSCIPRSLQQQIRQLSFLTRKRIRRRVQRSLFRISTCNADNQHLKIKYLLDLEKLEPSFGKETFLVRTPASGWGHSTEKLIRVCGGSGIYWSLKGSETWQAFCDFPEITDIGITQVCYEKKPVEGRIVTITKQENKALEAEFSAQKEAQSFVSLIDGYYRLTVDTCHYFCEEVAPPQLLWNLQNQCHGPITSEFAVNKLKRLGSSGGHYIVRCTPQHFDRYFLTVCIETSLGKDYKDCLVTKTDSGYSLLGVPRCFHGLKELLEYYQTATLHARKITIQLHSCYPPVPKEKSNLLIVRGSCPQPPTSPTGSRKKISQMTFQNIRPENLVWGESLGQGSFTKIFRGTKKDTDHEESYETEVVLKVLDGAYRNFSESFLEAASVMSQISHKHLVLLHGVCVGTDSIMVQEYVKFGPLDMYLKKHKDNSRITVRWKLEVAKQLAYALNFLGDKNIIHGNVSAKNILLSREGDASAGSPPFIKLSDSGVSISALTKELLTDRIPWVAPECVYDPRSLAQESDRWSFGTTLWEIFSSGSLPLSILEPAVKLQFYQDQLQLPTLKWTELANLIGCCMDYRAFLRPSFRAIIRDLNNLITSDYELLVDLSPGDLPIKDSFWRHMSLTDCQDPPFYEERHLKYISALGKGNFGSVDLCRYDPLGDNTGDLVAVKKLQQSTAERLRDFERESEILRSLHNDFIVQYRGVCYSAGRKNLQLIMEYLPNGCLREYLQKNQDHLHQGKLLLYAKQICKGMQYLGEKRYVHRDLATRNILVENSNHVKIGDFGLAKILPQDKEYYVVHERGESPIFWYAPESLADSVFSRQSDIWSFGVVLYELFTYGEKSSSPPSEFIRLMGSGKQLQLVSHMLELLKEGVRLPPPPGCPAEVFGRMLQCWALQPAERPTFSDLEQNMDGYGSSWD